MTPTNELRFVDRLVSADAHTGKWVRILQQKWEYKRVCLAVYITDSDGNPMPPPNKFEWRDIPVVREESTPDIEGYPV